MLSQSNLTEIDQLMSHGQFAQAGALLWQMQERDVQWLDRVVLLLGRLDAAGFRPHAQYWLELARPVAQRLNRCLSPSIPLPNYLVPEVVDNVLGKPLKRYPAFESSNAYIFVIEVAGACNLRCPSCPVGNMPDEPRPQGLMSIELFNRVLEKIACDRPDADIVIHLFNWGEPLLHPQLDDLIRAVRQRGWKSIVSTTLNVGRGLDKLVDAAPDVLKISMSGWDQDDYEKTHVRGDVNKVKENLRSLREMLDARLMCEDSSIKTVVFLGYHLYKHNSLGAEKVKKLAQELGFEYAVNNAVIQPIERNLDLLSGRADDLTNQIAEQLLVHPRDISRLNRARRSGQFDCEMRFNMTAINVDGSVALCCGTFSKFLQIHDNFLTADVQELEKSKYKSSFCAECMQCGFAYTVNDVLPS